VIDVSVNADNKRPRFTLVGSETLEKCTVRRDDGSERMCCSQVVFFIEWCTSEMMNELTCKIEIEKEFTWLHEYETVGLVISTHVFHWNLQTTSEIQSTHHARNTHHFRGG
jgi:hypothetical protein